MCCSWLRSTWSLYKQRYTFLTIGWLLTAAFTFLLSTFAAYLHIYNKCDMESVLLPLLAGATRLLNTVNTPYWIDYGSLLGSYRDGGIIPWDYDIDMSVMDYDCDKFLTLKPAMKEAGFTMYARGDYVAVKKNLILGYDAYLHKACARIYDSNEKYYIDFDWYRQFNYSAAIAEQIKEESEGRKFLLPDNYKESDGDIICNVEAWEAELPGGCRLMTWVFPLQKTTVLGVEELQPAKPPENLAAMYGPTWQTPRPKGYKVLVCSWLPLDSFRFFFVWLLVSCTPFALYFLLPKAWDKLMIAMGRKNVTHKYTTLPLHARY